MDVEALDANSRQIIELTLEPVIEAWGIERVQEVVSQMTEPEGWVAVLDGMGGARVLPAAQVLAANPDHMLDLLPGGQEASYVDGAIRLMDLPDARPVLVRQGAEVVGLLCEEPEKRKAGGKKRVFRLPRGGADAAGPAREAVKYHRETYPSRVHGDGEVVKDAIDMLLEEALSLIKRANGGTGVHVVLGQGMSGLWIGIETHGSYFPAAFLYEVLEEGPSEDPTTLALRKIRDMVLACQGLMKVMPTRTGTRFMISLPSPQG